MQVGVVFVIRRGILGGSWEILAACSILWPRTCTVNRLAIQSFLSFDTTWRLLVNIAIVMMLYQEENLVDA